MSDVPGVCVYPGRVLRSPAPRERATPTPTSSVDNFADVKALAQIAVRGVQPELRTFSPAADQTAHCRSLQAGAAEREGADLQHQKPPLTWPFFTDHEPDMELLAPFLFTHRKSSKHQVPRLHQHHQVEARLTACMGEYERRRVETPLSVHMLASEQSEQEGPVPRSEGFKSSKDLCVRSHQPASAPQPLSTTSTQSNVLPFAQGNNAAYSGGPGSSPRTSSPPSRPLSRGGAPSIPLSAEELRRYSLSKHVTPLQTPASENKGGLEGDVALDNRAGLEDDLGLEGGVHLEGNMGVEQDIGLEGDVNPDLDAYAAASISSPSLDKVPSCETYSTYAQLNHGHSSGRLSSGRGSGRHSRRTPLGAGSPTRAAPVDEPDNINAGATHNLLGSDSHGDRLKCLSNARKPSPVEVEARNVREMCQEERREAATRSKHDVRRSNVKHVRPVIGAFDSNKTQTWTNYKPGLNFTPAVCWDSLYARTQATLSIMQSPKPSATKQDSDTHDAARFARGSPPFASASMPDILMPAQVVVKVGKLRPTRGELPAHKSSVTSFPTTLGSWSTETPTIMPASNAGARSSSLPPRRLAKASPTQADSLLPSVKNTIRATMRTPVAKHGPPSTALEMSRTSPFFYVSKQVPCSIPSSPSFQPSSPPLIKPKLRPSNNAEPLSTISPPLGSIRDTTQLRTRSCTPAQMSLGATSNPLTPDILAAAHRPATSHIDASPCPLFSPFRCSVPVRSPATTRNFVQVPRQRIKNQEHERALKDAHRYMYNVPSG